MKVPISWLENMPIACVLSTHLMSKCLSLNNVTTHHNLRTGKQFKIANKTITAKMHIKYLRLSLINMRRCLQHKTELNKQIQLIHCLIMVVI